MFFKFKSLQEFLEKKPRTSPCANWLNFCFWGCDVCTCVTIALNERLDSNYLQLYCTVSYQSLGVCSVGRLLKSTNTHTRTHPPSSVPTLVWFHPANS